MVGTRLVTGPPDPGPRPHSASVLARPFTASHRHWSVRVQLANCPRRRGRCGALPNLPVSVGITAAAGAIGETCGSTQVNSSVTGAVSNLVPGSGEGGLNSVSNAVGGITGGLSGSQNGGPATGPLP